MKTPLPVVAVFVLLAVVGCSHPEKKPTTTTLTSNIPVALQHQGFRYMGLAYGQTRPMEMLQDGKVVCTGTQTAGFAGMKDGAALYTVTNTGTVGNTLGNLTYSVEKTGVYDISSTIEEGTTHDLELPASFQVGSKWTSKSTFYTKNGRKITVNDTSRVIGPQSVTTPAGTFDAMLVQSDGTADYDGEPFKVSSHIWYVLDRGLVKWQVVYTALPNSKPVTCLEEETK
jgi:hypothetical protein